MWYFQGKMSNSIGCAAGSLRVAELLRKGLNILGDTVLLVYLVTSIVLKGTMSCLLFFKHHPH